MDIIIFSSSISKQLCKVIAECLHEKFKKRPNAHSVFIEKKYSKKLHIITEPSSYIYSTETLFPEFKATVRENRVWVRRPFRY